MLHVLYASHVPTNSGESHNQGGSHQYTRAAPGLLLAGEKWSMRYTRPFSALLHVLAQLSALNSHEREVSVLIEQSWHKLFRIANQPTPGLGCR